MDKTITSPTEMIQILPGQEFEYARRFVDLGEEMGCKPTIRYATAHKAWKCVFARRKQAKVLFTLECTDSRMSVKACLFHIDKYRNAMENCADDICDKIKNAYDCHQCNTHCKGGCQFTLGDQSYRKCIGCCFYFSLLEDDDWKSLIRLLKLEAQF